MTPKLKLLTSILLPLMIVITLALVLSVKFGGLPPLSKYIPGKDSAQKPTENSEFSIKLPFVSGPQSKIELIQDNKTYKLELIADDLKKYKIDDELKFCGAPVSGAEAVKGDFKIKSGNSEVLIKTQEFVTGTFHDGTLLSEEFNENPSTKSQIAYLYLYGSCNSEQILVTGIDKKTGQVFQYTFAFTSPGQQTKTVCQDLSMISPDKKISKNIDGNLVTKCFNQETGKREVYTWQIVSAEKVFKQISFREELI